MQDQPSGMRPHIILLGRRNVGKSFLINALTDQPAALVSAVPGTTTDPVRKGFELLPFGPVVFIDTGGLDDEGELGRLRVLRAKKELATADFALLVTESGVWTQHEEALFSELSVRNGDFLVVVNKTDLNPGWRASVPAHYLSARTGHGVHDFRAALAQRLERVIRQRFSVIEDLVKPGDLVLLVVPIDLEAPRGRLILPQVITIRDVLDHDCASLVVKENPLKAALRKVGVKPALAVCDSQVVDRVSRDLPMEVPLTTFSILFARLKGDLSTLARGVETIDVLADGDRILIAEACSHHPVEDDIARVKIPKWLRERTGRKLHFDYAKGRGFPDDLNRYRLVIHCGGCMITPKVMQARMEAAEAAGVPITNYGVTISYCHGILERTLQPFKCKI